MANADSYDSTRAATIASYDRRAKDWKFQADLAKKEGEQLDKQILAAEIRKQMAATDLANHDQQIASAAEVNARVDEAINQVTAIRDEAQKKLDEARKAAEDAIAQAKDQAEKAQAEAEKRVEDAKQAAIDAAEKARHAAVWAAFLLATSTLISGAAAFSAAIKGGKDRDAGTVWGGLLHRPRV